MLRGGKIAFQPLAEVGRFQFDVRSLPAVDRIGVLLRSLKSIQIVFSSVYWSCACSELSRPPKARLLVAAERRRDVALAVTVDRDRAGANFARRAQRALAVGAEQAGGEAVIVSLAIAIASSVERTVMTASTGPKTSSRASLSPGLTPSMTVGNT